MSVEVLRLIKSHSKLERDRGVSLLEGVVGAGDTQDVGQVLQALGNNIRQESLPWEEKHGLLLALKVLTPLALGQNEGFEFKGQDFLETYLQLALGWLTDPEVRVRLCAGELLGVFCREAGHSVYDRCKETVLGLVAANLERKVDVEGDNMGGAEEIKQTEILFNKLSGNSGGDAALIFHDTAGWKNLETSMAALQRMLEGCGPHAVQYVDSHLLNLIFSCLEHTNRFVRETGFHVMGSLVSVCASVELATELTGEGDDAMEVEGGGSQADPLEEYGTQFSQHLALGLADNWSQVRLAASTATRAFLLGLSEEARDEYYPTLLPRICLNRYYLAEGVRLYSQATWKAVCGDRGKLLVETNIEATVQYYVECTEADNHAVREAACQCIAELANKMDKEVLKVHVAALLDTLVECFKDESWPVRDMACVAAGSFIKCFPQECSPCSDLLLSLFLSNLGDPIASVRQGAALSLANYARAWGEQAGAKLEAKILEGLAGVVNQPQESAKFTSLDTGATKFGVARRISDHNDDKHENQVMYSCGSLAPKMSRGGGGCSDARFSKPSEPWELADGCVHAVAELAGVPGQQERSGRLLPAVLGAASHRGYSSHLSLVSSLCTRIADMAPLLGKRIVKQHLESSLDTIFYAIDSESAIAQVAAEECLGFLSSFLGPNILKGRVEQYNSGYAQRLERLLGCGPGPPGPGSLAFGVKSVSRSSPVEIPSRGHPGQPQPSLGGTPT